MKKVKKLLSKKTAKKSDAPLSQITNETVAEHREKILAGGRKFKYPVQYAKSRLIRNTLLISVATIIVAGALVWWQLYPSQSRNTFFYRITQILPLPVAEVDGKNVPYSYYLLSLRGATYAIEHVNNVSFATKDGERQLEYLKRQALNGAIEYAYAQKLADEMNITVTDKEMDDELERVRSSEYKGVINQSAFETAIRQTFNWSYDEYRTLQRSKILKQKVIRQIDQEALRKANSLDKQLKSGADFTTLAKANSDDAGADQSGGDQGLIARDSQDPNGLVAEAVKLQKDQVSGVINGVDGYYIIKVTEANDTQVRYARIFIRYNEFNKRLDDLRRNNGIKESIDVPTDVGPVQQ